MIGIGADRELWADASLLPAYARARAVRGSQRHPMWAEQEGG